MRCVSALSTDSSTDRAREDVIGRAARDLPGPADLAVVFASMHHAGQFERISAEIRERGLGRHVLGCTAESVIGEGREIEGEPALSLWALSAPGIGLSGKRVACDENGQGDQAGWLPELAAIERPSILLLGDPFTFSADDFLRSVNAQAPGAAVVGGMASGANDPASGRTNRLLLDGEVYDDGAVALVVSGPVRLRTVVSQGCRPIGRPLIVTRAQGAVIYELGRRPALEVLQEIFDELPPEDQHRARNGLHIGRVISEYQETFHQGDFLVRNVRGVVEGGGIAVTDLIRVGQTVQFHVRDAETADVDLRGLLSSSTAGSEGSRAAGALLFSCNGRGTRLCSEANHDVGLVREILGLVPVAGFFAMGEIGPVGGQSFVHGFTASVAIFEEGIQSSHR